MSPLQTPSAPLEIVAVLLLFVVPAIAGYKCAKGHDKRLWLTFLSFVLGWIGFIKKFTNSTQLNSLNFDLVR